VKDWVKGMFLIEWLGEWSKYRAIQKWFYAFFNIIHISHSVYILQWKGEKNLQYHLSWSQWVFKVASCTLWLMFLDTT
jgi:hypothetical protein